MLVLSRKSTETITIGDNISIEIRRIAGNRVTLAIDAPRDVRILRGELEAAAKAFEAPATEEAEEAAPQADSAATTYEVCHHRIAIGSPVSSVASPTSAVG